jgi:proteic killer suppression protein
MIRSFANKETAATYAGLFVRSFGADWVGIARRKLAQLDAATTLDFLRLPPGNRLEALSGNRAGQHSIRINGQWRLCFVWLDGAAWDVEIVDYH